MLNAKRIALLRDDAIVFNASRGTVTDDDALMAALKSGKVAAAGLDVYLGENGKRARFAFFKQFQKGMRDRAGTSRLWMISSPTWQRADRLRPLSTLGRSLRGGEECSGGYVSQGCRGRM